MSQREKQVMALEGDYTPACIRTAIRNSLKSRALQDISVLPLDTNWKVPFKEPNASRERRVFTGKGIVVDSCLETFYHLELDNKKGKMPCGK